MDLGQRRILKPERTPNHPALQAPHHEYFLCGLCRFTGSIADNMLYDDRLDKSQSSCFAAHETLLATFLCSIHHNRAQVLQEMYQIPCYEQET